MATKKWKFIVYETDGTTTDFEITNSQLVKAPTIPAPRAEPLEGTVDSISFDIEVGDFSSFVSDKLYDSDNRSDLQGRKVEAKIDTGNGFSSVWIGRWIGVAETQGPGKYAVRLSDEHWKTRQATIFRTQDTTQLFPNYPAGLQDKWNTIQPGGEITSEVVDKNANGIRLALTGKTTEAFENTDITARAFDNLVDFIEDDQKQFSERDTNAGNFDQLRAIADSTEYEVITFGGFGTTLSLDTFLDDPPRWPPFVWIDWTVSQPNIGDFVDLNFHADGSVTSKITPYHIGGDNGVDPFQFLKDRYDDEGIRYDSNVFNTYNKDTNPQGLIDHPFIPRMWWRITEPQKLGPWSEKNIFQPLGIVPFINNSGEIAPRFVFLPIDEDPTTFTTADETNIGTDGHPTFNHAGTEAITAVRSVYKRALTIKLEEQGDKKTLDAESADVLEIKERETPFPQTHDRLSAVGRRTHELIFTGVWSQSVALRIQDELAIEIFDRFGDGPIRGEMSGLSALESIDSGEFFLIDLDTFPNAVATGSRGGTRVVQHMGRDLTPFGPKIYYLDAGPNDQPLQTPSITISKNSNAPKHAVDVTISTIDSNAKKWHLQLKVDDDRWSTFATTDIGTTTATVDQLPAGSSIDARAQVTAPNRIRSDWSTVKSVTLDSLTAPSNVNVTGITGTTATVTWTNGEDDEKVQILLDSNLVITLPAGSTKYVLEALEKSTSYTVSVRHIGPFGSISNTASANFQTTETNITAPKPIRLGILIGEIA